MEYLRLYADAAGETHFEDLELTFTAVNYAPPAPSVEVSAFAPAAVYGVLRGPVGWYGDWHPIAQRQVHFYLAGEIDVMVSDGEVRRVGAGTMVLVEDTTGKGHRSEVVGTEQALIAVVHLPDH